MAALNALWSLLWLSNLDVRAVTHGEKIWVRTDERLPLAVRPGVTSEGVV